MSMEAAIPVQNTEKTKRLSETEIPANSRKNRVDVKKTKKYLIKIMSSNYKIPVKAIVCICECQAYGYSIANRMIWPASAFLLFCRVGMADNQLLHSLATNSVNYKGQTFYTTGYAITA